MKVLIFGRFFLYSECSLVIANKVKQSTLTYKPYNLMTKKQDDTLLEEALKEVVEAQQELEAVTDDSNDEIDYKQLYEETKKKLEESELITKRAQSDYFRQKMDFDALVARREEEKKTEKVDAVISLTQKIIPGLANLQVSLAHIPADLIENKRVEGIKMTADKQLKDIE
jgi:molecular chaperone GrpE (heat shock protein)